MSKFFSSINWEANGMHLLRLFLKIKSHNVWFPMIDMHSRPLGSPQKGPMSGPTFKGVHSIGYGLGHPASWIENPWARIHASRIMWSWPAST